MYAARRGDWRPGKKNVMNPEAHCGVMEATTRQVKFEVLMVETIQDKVFWVVTLCSVVVEYHCFRDPRMDNKCYTTSQPSRQHNDLNQSMFITFIYRQSLQSAAEHIFKILPCKHWIQMS
jgi:hypothetical protein